MADYLSQLVAKNLARQETIQPRLRGRFEPSPDISVDSPPVEVAHTGVPQPVTSPVADSAAPTLKADQMPAHPLEEPGSFEPEPPAIVPTYRMPKELTIRPYRGRLNPPPALPPSPATQPASRSEAPPQAASLASPHPTTPANQPENPLPSKLERPQISANVRLPGPPETPREVMIERRSERTRISTIKAAVELPQEEPADSLPPTPWLASPETLAFAHEPATQDLRPVTTPLPELAARNTPSEPTPTVHVTIGRIEVRATPPPPSQPRKPSPAPKVMSLDEYLQSRSNGGGR